MEDITELDLAGYAPIPLGKDLASRLLSSREMAVYLADQKLSVGTLIETIQGAPVPLEDKREIFQSLARQYGGPFLNLAQQADKAIQGLVTKPGEFFYIKNCLPDYDTGFVDVDGMEPYPNLNSAMEGIRRFLLEEECAENSVYWFLLEKWSLNGEGQYVCPYTYTVADSKILFYNRAGEGYLFEQSTHLNLPIPFRPGDLVRLDCAPFAFRANAVILEVGDNCDCCCVQAMFREANGNWSAGALKHGHTFPNYYMPLLSPLYRLATVRREDLAEDEKLLEEVSRFVSGSGERGASLEAALVAALAYGHNAGLPESEIRDFLRDREK